MLQRDWGYSSADAEYLATMSHALLNGVAATITHRDRDELDRSVAQLLLQFLATHSVTLLRLVDDGQVRQVVRRVSPSQHGGEAGPVSSDESSKFSALADFPAGQECAARNEIVRCEGTDGRWLTVFPIQGERTVVGLLVVETATALSSREADLVQGILGIVRNHLALLDYGERDTLTGLLNRKTFESYFDKQRLQLTGPPQSTRLQNPSGHSPAAREPSWLALIDIDHFKAINDGYGHLFGDEVLLLVSRLMQRAIRGADQLFRFGGEEFIIVLDRASESGAGVVFERLRATIEEYEFPQVGRVTVSMGYTRIDPADVPALCVERADAALYYAKGHGRNNVRNCETLLAAGEIVARRDEADVELF
jgi:diguanylate cyclase (GGDEF)-like protein